MKISGKHFKRGMRDNAIIIQGDSISIHSSEGETGVFRKELNKLSTHDEELRFNLSAKDFSLVSKFDDLKIDLPENTILFKSKNSTFKIQNYEHNFISPSKEDRVELSAGVGIGILEIASNFVNPNRPEMAGILVYPTCIIGASGSTLYKYKAKTGNKFIHIPLSFLKVLEGKEYKLTCTDKFIFASKEGEIAYSALCEQKIPALDEYDPKLPGSLSCDLNELKEHLSIAENFSKYVFLEIKNDKLLIYSVMDEGQHKDYSATIKLSSTNIESYKKAFIITNLLKILNTVVSKEMNIDDKCIVLKNMSELAMVAVYSQPGESGLVIKKVEETIND